jgi:hypothetical protein
MTRHQAIEFISDETPFLAMTHWGDFPTEYGRVGFGPRYRLSEPVEQAEAEREEKWLIGLSIDRWIRGQIYLRFRNDNLDNLERATRSAPPGSCFIVDNRPLREDDRRRLLDPLIIQERSGSLVSEVNPAWVEACWEYGFWLAPGVTIPLSGEVLREPHSYAEDARYLHSKYEIKIAVKIPNSGVGMFRERRQR